MYESFLAILQVLTTPVDYAAIAISASAPIGLATGVYATQNGLKFFPWFLAGTFAPGLSLFPLQRQIRLLVEQKSKDRVQYLLTHGQPLSLIPKKESTAPTALEELLQDADENDEAFIEALTAKKEIEDDSTTIESVEAFYARRNINLSNFVEADTESDQEQIPVNLKWINESNEDKPVIRFMDMNPEIFKENVKDSLSIKQAQLNHFLEFLDGVWLHFEKENKSLKKAFFSSEKFGLLTSSRANNIPTQYAEYAFQGHICIMKLKDRNLPIRVVSADIIFINGERFVRYKKTAMA